MSVVSILFSCLLVSVWTSNVQAARTDATIIYGISTLQVEQICWDNNAPCVFPDMHVDVRDITHAHVQVCSDKTADENPAVLASEVQTRLETLGVRSEQAQVIGEWASGSGAYESRSFEFVYVDGVGSLSVKQIRCTRSDETSTWQWLSGRRKVCIEISVSSALGTADVRATKFEFHRDGKTFWTVFKPRGLNRCELESLVDVMTKRIYDAITASNGKNIENGNGNGNGNGSSKRIALPDHTYIGCYVDHVKGKRDLHLGRYGSIPGGEKHPDKWCAFYCRTVEGAKYFGLQYGDECWCGDGFGSQGVAEGECTKPCKGNKSMMCGNGNRNSVYKLTWTSVQAGFEYKGCYRDLANGKREMNLTPWGLVPRWESRPDYWCAQYCKQHAPGARYFGLQYHDECWCGDKFDTQGETANDCNIPCRANPSIMCGGRSRNAVYELMPVRDTDGDAKQLQYSADSVAVAMPETVLVQGGSATDGGVTGDGLTGVERAEGVRVANEFLAVHNA